MKKGQSLRPLELVLVVGILGFGFLLLFFYVSLSNAGQERSIEVEKSKVGAGVLLVDLLEHEAGGKTVADMLLNNEVQTGSVVRAYFIDTESPFFYYELYRNGELVTESLQDVENEASITYTLTRGMRAVNVTLVYEK